MASTRSAELVRGQPRETPQTNPDVPKTLSDEPRKGGRALRPKSRNHGMTARRVEDNPASQVCQHGYIAQWLEGLAADQQVPGSNPGMPFYHAYPCGGDVRHPFSYKHIVGDRCVGGRPAAFSFLGHSLGGQVCLGLD